MDKKHVVIIGAGPGGLTAGMLLAHRGFKVSIFEQKSCVGGRNAAIKLGDYIFDTGPTFLMMKFVLDEIFEETNRRADDYFEFVKLEPMYRLKFQDMTIDPTSDHEDMKAQIKRHFPGNEDNLDMFIKKELVRFERMLPCLQKDYSSFNSFFSSDLIKALPHLSVGRSLFDVLGNYFDKEKLKLSFTFQSKYLGMSPWECPGAFAMLSFVEHRYGIYHVMGGLSEISEVMAKLIKEEGGEIHLHSPVKKVLVQNGAAVGVQLESGEKIQADDVIINADFADAMSKLIDNSDRKKYTNEKLNSMKYSCSTFMLYLGLDKIYDTPHHTIVFAKDYKQSLKDIFEEQKISLDNSFYVRNSSVTDKKVAPLGHSAIYVLVPVCNNKSGIDWEKEKKSFRDLIIKTIEERMPLPEIENHIKEEKIITPADWKNDYSVYFGATFNLAHNIKQLLYFRPHNKFEEFDNCYLTGGGTHPGSGLPTIYESARISANLISKKHNVKFISKNIMV